MYEINRTSFMHDISNVDIVYLLFLFCQITCRNVFICTNVFSCWLWPYLLIRQVLRKFYSYCFTKYIHSHPLLDLKIGGKYFQTPKTKMHLFFISQMYCPNIIKGNWNNISSAIIGVIVVLNLHGCILANNYLQVINLGAFTVKCISYISI